MGLAQIFLGQALSYLNPPAATSACLSDARLRSLISAVAHLRWAIRCYGWVTSVDSTVCCAGGALGAREKEPGRLAPTASRSGRRMGCECRDVGSAHRCGVTNSLDYATDGPDPGREFSGRGDVCLVLVGRRAPASPRLFTSLRTPLARVPSCRRVGICPLAVFGVRRRVQVVPSRLDEHPSQVLVAGLGDAANARSPAGVLGR